MQKYSRSRAFDFNEDGEVVERATKSDEDETERIVPIRQHMIRGAGRQYGLHQARGPLIEGVERATRAEEDDTERIAPIRQTKVGGTR